MMKNDLLQQKRTALVTGRSSVYWFDTTYKPKVNHKQPSTIPWTTLQVPLNGRT